MSVNNKTRTAIGCNTLWILCPIALLTISLPVLSEPIADFCLSKVGQRPSEDFTEPADPNFKPVTLDFSAHGKTYHLVSGKHHVALQDEQHNILAVANSRQEQGSITNLEFRHGQLYIEGGTDYIAWVDQKSDPPRLNVNTERFVNLRFSAGGKAYRLVSNRLQGPFVELLDGDNQHLSTLPIKPSDDDDGLFDFALSKSGWLWVDGWVDYVVPVDLNATPPTFGTPIELSKLTDTECLPMTWFFGCYPTQGFYSHALERIFVSSTNRSLWGLFPPVNLEVVDGKSRPLPAALNNVSSSDGYIGVKQLLFRDVSMLHGTLFTGAAGEALFYEGKTVTSLLDTNIWKNPQCHECPVVIGKAFYGKAMEKH